jgi:serine/threonine-protein phosphatase 6 catalytic subunit
MSVNIDKLISGLRKSPSQIVPERELKIICEQVRDIFLEESNVQPVHSPVSVCGDIHGQFFDLLELFKAGGEIPDKAYIFIGDFVDRGYNSVETFELFLLLKIRYPDRITLLRGNHESRGVTMAYGFYDECEKKYGNANAWKYCTDVMDYLPLAALIDNSILCVHGGISPRLKTIDQLRLVDRMMEIPSEGPFSDLMWSDPDDIESFILNARGAGWIYGRRAVKDFNHINGLSLICRAHQVVREGYIFWFDQQLVTVWSAPNYCYRCGNQASIGYFNENLEQKWILFKESPDSINSVPPKNVLPYFL